VCSSDLLPNVLVETAFLSNPEDEMKLLDDNFRTAIADKIVAGLEQFVRLYGRRDEEKSTQ
jgi:N-acetylmuramoyl-L-alanine amidase